VSSGYLLRKKILLCKSVNDRLRKIPAYAKFFGGLQLPVPVKWQKPVGVAKGG